jgi:hypothetical protein
MLSDAERRRLADLERTLTDEDPALANLLATGGHQIARRGRDGWPGRLTGWLLIGCPLLLLASLAVASTWHGALWVAAGATLAATAGAAVVLAQRLQTHRRDGPT